jgi:hypothetical protein
MILIHRIRSEPEYGTAQQLTGKNVELDAIKCEIFLLPDFGSKKGVANSNYMRSPFKTSLTRREMLKDTALASGALLTGFEKLVWPMAARAAGQEGFSGGRQLGVEKFTGEPRIKMNTVIGEEWLRSLIPNCSPSGSSRCCQPKATSLDSCVRGMLTVAFLCNFLSTDPFGSATRFAETT